MNFLLVKILGGNLFLFNATDLLPVFPLVISQYVQKGN